jgi:hypothetical protein
MIFKLGNSFEQVGLYFDDIRLNVVSKFCYLGVVLTGNGKFYHAQNSLSEQALRAIFTLNSLFDVVPLGVNENIKLFDSMTVPILNYGCEIWGFHKAPDIERVYIKFCKQLLCVRSQSTNIAVLGELGKVPLDVVRKRRILKYWYRILNSQDTLIYTEPKQKLSQSMCQLFKGTT